MPDEIVYLREPHVLITSARAVFYNRTYATRHINSVRVFVKEPQRAWWIVLIVLGALMLVYGLPSMLSQDDSMFACGVAMFGFGLLPLAGGIVGLVLGKNRYFVRIATSSGEVDALGSRDAVVIERVVNAVTDAITGQLVPP